MVSKYFSALKKQTGILIGAICFMLALILFQANLLNGFDNMINDTWALIKPPIDADSRIALIGIDTATLSKLKGYPLERSQYTNLFKILQQHPPKVIGFNILLTDLKIDKTDQELAEVIKKLGNVIMPIYYDYASEKVIFLPAKKFMESAQAVGNVSTFLDADGITRHIEPQVLDEGSDKIDKYWSFGIQVLKHYLELSTEDIKIENWTLNIGPDQKSSLDHNHLLPLNFLGASQSFKVYPLHKVVSGQIDPEVFKDKIILIGSMTMGLGDFTTVPVSKHPIFGIEIQATLIDNLLRSRILYTFPEPLLMLMTFFLGILLAQFLYKNSFSSLIQIMLVLLFISWFLFISYMSYAYFNVLFNISPLIVGSILTLVSMFTYAITLTNVYFNREIDNLKGLYQKRIYLAHDQKLIQSLDTLSYLCQASYVRFWQKDNDKLLFKFGSQHAPSINGNTVLSYKQLLPFLNQSNRSISYHDLPQEWKQNTDDETLLLQFLVITKDTEFKNSIILEIAYEKQIEIPLPLLNEITHLLFKNLQKTRNISSFNSTTKTIVKDTKQKIEILSSLTSQIEMDREAFSAVLSASHNAMFLCDSFAEIQYLNSKLLEILLLPLDSRLEGENVFEHLSSHFSIKQETWKNIWSKAFSYRQTTNMSLNYESHYYSFSLTPVLDKNGVVDGILGVITDITDLYKQANYDGLTALRNRQNFNEILNQEFLRSRRNASNYFTLILVDIDHFKKFNDTYGHQVGDNVLKIVARTLASNVRSTDFVARYGGEEMALILPMTDLIGASIVAEKLRQKVEDLSVTDLEGNEISSISISLGLAIYQKEDPDVETLLKRSDDALYHSKDKGRNQGFAYQGKMLVSAIELSKKYQG